MILKNITFLNYVTFLHKKQIYSYLLKFYSIYNEFINLNNFALIQHVNWFMFFNGVTQACVKTRLCVYKTPVLPISHHLKMLKFAERHFMHMWNFTYNPFLTFLKQYKRKTLKKLKIKNLIFLPRSLSGSYLILLKTWHFLIGNSINFLSWSHTNFVENLKLTTLQQLKKLPNKTRHLKVSSMSLEKKLKKLFIKNYDYFLLEKLPFNDLLYGFKKLIAVPEQKSHFTLKIKPYLFLNSPSKVPDAAQSSIINQWFVSNYKFYSSVASAYKKTSPALTTNPDEIQKVKKSNTSVSSTMQPYFI